MRNYLFSRLAVIGLGAAIAAAGAAPAQAASGNMSAVDTSSCSTPAMSQPFQSWGDSNWYTLAQGQTSAGFNGSGWTLTGGAHVVPTTLANGSTATVLDLPSGSQAVSPAICVASDYPTARTMVRNVVGAEGVQFAVSYAGTKTATAPKTTGQIHGQGTAWTLSQTANMQPYNVTGWQLVNITLTPGGTHSDFQVYNLYVDPKMRG
jgi:hypothetical protein